MVEPFTEFFESPFAFMDTEVPMVTFIIRMWSLSLVPCAGSEAVNFSSSSSSKPYSKVVGRD